MKPNDPLKTKRRIRMEAAAAPEVVAKPVAKKIPKKSSKEY